MLNLPAEETFHLMDYWLGGFLRETSFDEDFPELADMGPVSHTLPKSFCLHEHMLVTLLEAVGRGEVTRNNLKLVSTKAIYFSRMNDLLTPTKELKFPQVNFPELVYPRLRNQVLEVKQKHLLFSIIHGIYRNR